MKKINVYLAGYISGKKAKECTVWRNNIKTVFSNNKEDKKRFNFIDPMDAHKHPEKTIDSKGLKANDCSEQDIFYRDYNSVRNSDILIANMSTFGATNRPLTGTIFEIAWAYEWKMPIILITEDENYIEHPFTKMVALTIVPNLLEAIKKVKQLSYTFGE